jgi:hypothetical protein
MDAYRILKQAEYYTHSFMVMDIYGLDFIKMEKLNFF